VAAAPISLDQGPPLPPNLQPAPQASAASLAGGQAQSSGSAALQQQVVERAMFAQKTMEDIGKLLPAAAQGMAGVIDMFQKVLGSILAQGASPPPAPSATGASLIQQPPGQTPGA